MNFFAILAGLALSYAPLVHAHVEKGTYQGKTPAGALCSMISEGTHFENNVHHPLMERVKVTIGNDGFLLQHPAVIDPAKGVASFNHDFFQGVLPTSSGAKALVVTMLHSEEYEGPVSFTLIDHVWKNPAGSVLQCNDLRLQP